MSSGSPPAELRVPLHPLLLACVPVLLLWSSNADQVDPGVVVGSLVASLILAGALLTAGRAILGDWQRAGCWASFGLVVFFLHGFAVDALLGEGLLARTALAQALPLIADLIVLGIAGVFLLRTPLRLDFIASLITAAAAAVVAYSLLQGFIGLATEPGVASSRASEAVDPGATIVRAAKPGADDAASQPDVYYLVLDGYAGESVLQSAFQHDNSPFLEALRRRGFYVAEESRSNYSMTHLSLSSVLNAAYLDELARELGPDSQSFAKPYALLRNHWVGRFFRAQGYRYAQLFTNWSGTERSEIADVGYSYVPAWLGGEFVGLLLQATPLRDFAPSVADFHRFGFDAVREASELAGPTFVFAHLLLPHEPYVFDSQGGVRVDVPLHLRAQRAAKDAAAAGRGDEAYVEQLKFLNAELIALVDELLENSSQPPVIVLQGDHGWASHGAVPGSQEFIAARFPILNALYVPEAVRDRLYPSISSVNTFRVLLSELFATELPLLPDRQYWSWYDAPYQLRELSAKLGPLSKQSVAGASASE